VVIEKRGSMSVQYEKRYFSVIEYYRMAEAGVLSPDDRVELIEGEIVKMSPIGSRHAACVRRLDAFLNHQAGDLAQVSVQSPVRLNDFSEPEPDIALLKPRDDFYADSHPTPADVLLIIEVADTSVEYDRSIKLPLYARAGIPQVLIVNMPSKMIESYAEPVNGAYQKVMRAQRGESVEIVLLPNLPLSVDVGLAKDGI
jgi:Uma2 family endonuclease